MKHASFPPDYCKRKAVRILVGSIFCLLASQAALLPAHAVDVTWDIAPGTVGAGNGTITGGTGAWDTTNGNWTTDGGANNIAWDNAGNDTAVFGGTAGTVTLGTGIILGGLTFNAAYLLTADVLILGLPGTITTNVSSQIDSGLDANLQDLTFGGAGNLTVSNPITNGAALAKTGAGTLTLNGTSNFTSLTTNGGTITGGTLWLDSGNTALISGGTSAVDSDVTFTTLAGKITSNAGTLTLGGTLDASGSALAFDGAGHTTVSNAIANGTSLTKTGTGTLTLAGLNTYGSGTTISAGVVNIQSATALGNTSNGTTVASGAALQIQGNTTVGAEALTLNGTGIAGDGALRNISGNNVWQGTVTLNSAARINSDAGSLTFNTAANSIIATNQNLTLGGAGNGTVGGVIATGTGTLIKDGAGTWTLAGTNTFTGQLTVQNGTLAMATINNDNANGVLGNSALSVILGNTGGQTGTLEYTGTTASSNKKFTLATGGTGAFRVDDGTGATQVLTLSGVINGSGGLTKTGADTLLLSAANTHTGDTLVSFGVLNLGNNLVLQNSAIDTSGAGTITLTTTTPTFGGLKGSANLAAVITIGYGGVTALTLNPGTAVANAYSGGIANGSGNTTLTKTGAGTQTLSGTLTYTGATTVSTGTLVLSGNNVAATGDITVNSGGVVQFNTTNSISGGAHNVLNRDVTVSAGGAVVFGPAFGVGIVDVQAALANRIVAASAGAIAADNYVGAAFDFSAAGLTSVSLGAVGTVTYSGTLTPNGTTYRLGGGGGTLNYGSAITGAGNSLAVSGAGTVGLSLANSYGAGTTVSGGTLLLSGSGTLGSTTGTLAVSGGILDLGGSSQTVGAITLSSGTIQNGTLAGASFSMTGGTMAASLVGSGTITATGNPTILNGNNSGFSGAINVTSNTLRAIAPASLGSGLVTLSTNTTLSLVNDGSGTGLGNGKPETLNYVAALTLSGNASVNVDRFTASGSGVVFNAQNKTMRLGALSIGSQTLTVGNSNGCGLEFSGTTTLTGATPNFNVGGGSNAPVVQGLTLSGQVTGAFGFTKSGGGTLVLTNATNNFGSASTINITSGLLSATSSGALGHAGNIISLNSGGFQASGTFSTARQVNTTGGGGVIDVTQGSTPGSLTMLTLTTAFNGGAASANGLTKNGNGILEINANNNGGTPYTGVFTINAGAVRISLAGALGAAANNTVVANNVGAALQINGVATSELLTINNTGLNSGGAIENVAGNGAVNGAITLGSAASIGSSAGTLDIGGPIAGPFGLTFSGAGNINLNTALNVNVTPITKLGSGTTTIAVNNSSSLASITINAGTFQVGSITTGLGKTNGPLTVNPGATLKVDNTFAGDDNRLSGKGVTLAGASLDFTGNAVTNTTESIGGLSLGVGSSTVTSTYTGADTFLSFLSLSSRAAGGTRNFAVMGGTNGSTNQIVIGTLAQGYIDHGSFFGGDAYAYMDDAGTFLRGAVYGSDAGFDTSAGAVSITITTHQEITGAVTAQNSASFTTFKISGNNPLTLAPGQTVTASGLLKAGNVAGGAAISGGSGIKAANNAELVIRTDGASDLLTISTPILAQGTNALTKTGLGTLVLSGANTYTGQTTVNQGTLTLSGGNHRLAAGNPLVVNQGGTLSLGLSNQYVGNLSSTSTVQDAGGIITASGGTLTVNQTTAATFAGSLQGSVNLIKTGGQTLTLTSANTTTGTIAVVGGLGTLRERNEPAGDLGYGLTLRDGGALPNISGLTLRNATLNLDNSGYLLGNASHQAASPLSRQGLANRISDTAPITLDNATIRYVGRSQTNSTETIGPVTTSGFSSITMLTGGSSQGGTGVNSATLTLAGLTRNSGSMIQFNRSGGTNTPLGTIGNFPRVLLANDNTSGLTFSNNTVVGMVSYIDNDKLMPVGYVPGLGFGSMGSTGFPNNWMPGANQNTGFTNLALDTASTTTDYITAGAPVVKLGGQTINALGIQGSGFGASTNPLTFQSAGDTLTLASGWLAMWFQQTQIGTVSIRGAITSGQSELFLHGTYLGAWGTAGNVNTIHSVVKDNGGNPVKFVMSLGRNITLTASNTYTGGSVVNAILALDGGGTYLNTLTLGGSAGSVAIPNATNPANGLVINSATVVMQGNQGQIGANNIVTLNGSSVLTLTGSNTLAGLVFNSNGGTATPTVTPGASLTLTGNIIANPSNAAVTPIINGGSLNFAGATRTITVGTLPEGDFTGYTGLQISSSIQNGSLTKEGAGRLTLSGGNSYAGTTTINAGTLQIGAAGGTGSLNLDSAIVNHATLVFNRTNTSTQQGALGVISGPGAVIQAGTGTTVLAGENTYTGVTTVSAGVLQLENANALPGGVATAGGTSNLTFDGGVLGLGTDNASFTRSLNTAATAAAVTFAGPGGWAAYGLDAVVNLGGGGTIAWGTPSTGLNGQTLILGASTADMTVDLQNALNLGTTNRTVQVENGGAAIDGRLTGAISGTGAGGLTKTGAGTLNLDNPTQSYDALTANAGTTNVNGTLGTAPGLAAVSVNNAGTSLKFGSVTQTLGSLTIGAGATVTFTSGLASFTGDGNGGKAPNFGGSAVVPEPGTIGLLLVGALGALSRRRRPR